MPSSIVSPYKQKKGKKREKLRGKESGKVMELMDERVEG